MEITNNPAAGEAGITQEPQGSLGEAEVITVEGTGAEVVQPQKDTTTEAITKGVDKGVDLNKAIEKLTPAEQKAYKAFQAEYTRKSQSLSETEMAKAKYEGYLNSLVADPEISAILKARRDKAEIEKEPDFGKMNDEEIFNYTVDKRVKAITAELETKMDAKYGTYIQSRLVDEGNKIINDFAEAKKITVEEVMELSKYAINHQVPLEDAYKVAYADKIPQQARQEALDDLDLKKKANLELGVIPTGVTPIMPEKQTFSEAAANAEKQTGLSWAKVKTE